MQLFLTGITHAWLLYFGLLFVGMILWAPTGLAGIIMAHQPVWKAGLMKRLLPAYGLIAVPTLVMFLGGMTLIEINYHLSLSIKPEEPMSIFGISFHAQSPMAWITAVALLVVGFYFFRRTQRIVRRSWNEVRTSMKEER
jgi:branched-chain amino acid transport system permease protein